MNIAIQDRSFAEQKLVAGLSLIDRVLSGDWPYDDPQNALRAIREQFSLKLEGLRGLEPDAGAEITAAWCSDARSIVARYHTFIGVILRSSNVRNAFEVFAPIKEITKALLGSDYQIVLGSEWSYSPFVFPLPMPGLENFVFIGLPAAEAGNSLLTPLAGHELGHAVWRKPDVNSPIKDRVRQEIVSVFLKRSRDQPDFFADHPLQSLEKDFRFRSLWKKPYELALRQREEVFCDLLGCWLFGNSFLHAFRYMMCPEVGHRSAEYYPSNRFRAEYLDAASKKFHGEDTDLKSFFEHGKVSDDLRTADEATNSVVSLILDEVDKFCLSRNLQKPTKEETEKALERLPITMHHNLRPRRSFGIRWV